MFRTILSCLLYCSSALGVVVGSNNGVGRPSFVVIPAGQANEIRGFTALSKGLGLQNAQSHCIFNALFPISGVLDLRGGTLELRQDLKLVAPIVVSNSGTIIGNNHSLVFAGTIEEMIIEEGEALLGQLAQFDGNNIRTVDWSYDGQFVALGSLAGLSGLSGNNFGVLEFDEGSLTVRASSSFGSQVNAIRWHPTQHDLAVCGNFSAMNPEIQIRRFNTTTHEFTQTDSVNFNVSVFALAWRLQGDYLATAKNNTPSNPELAVYPYNTSAGTLGSPITFDINPNATTDPGGLAWDPSGNYLAVGVTSNTGTELQIYHFTGSSLTFTIGAEIGVHVSAVSWSPTGSFIAVGLSGGSTRLRVFEHSVSSGTLTQVDSVSESLSVLSVDWRNDGDWLSVGRAAGVGTELRVYAFDNVSKTLTLGSSVELTTATNETRWALDGNFLAIANASFMRIFNFFDGQLGPTGDVLAFEDLHIILNDDVTFRAPVQFRGRCIVDGNRHNLNVMKNSDLIVAPGASLLCRRLTMTSDRILMLDQNSSVTLSDVSWQLDNDVSFTQGHIAFQRTVRLSGPHSFSYQSDRQALIDSYATLVIDNGSTFSYSPANGMPDLLCLKDRTSRLHLRDARLHVSSDLQLSKGIVRVDGTCFFNGETEEGMHAIQFGDGVDADNDVDIELLAGSGLQIVSGQMIYNNVS